MSPQIIARDHRAKPMTTAALIATVVIGAGFVVNGLAFAAIVYLALEDSIKQLQNKLDKGND